MLVQPLEAENLTMQDIVTEILKFRARSLEEAKQEQVFMQAVKNFNTQLIANEAQKIWLLKELPLKVLTIKLLYRGTRDGFSGSVFHSLCDNKGPTITLMKSKKGKVFGGFTRESWESPSGSGKWKQDEQAFLFSVELQKTYKVFSVANAIFCSTVKCPSFGGNALCIIKDPLNADEGGISQQNGYNDGKNYGIRSDSQGNNLLIGEGSEQDGDSKRFTCTEIEVYAVSFNK